MKTYNYITLADIHFGAFSAKRLYEELEEKVFKFIETQQKLLDIVFIAGDFYDAKISLDSDSGKYALYFFTKLTKYAVQYNFKIRMIKGTKSHDNSQLKALELIAESIECDFKVFNTLGDEWVYPDLHVLYIPEEYIEDQEEYYSEHLNKLYEYDITIMHGLIKETAFVASKQESEVTMKKAPIFDLKKLLGCTKGPIHAGHVHTKAYYDRFDNVSSFSRWSHGEEEDKGFDFVSYSPVSGKFALEFIVNDMAQKFETIKLEPDFLNKDLTTVIADSQKIVETAVNERGIDNIKLKYYLENDNNSSMIITSLKETFSKDKRVKVDFINKTKAHKEQEESAKIQNIMERYGLIFDKGVPYETKISEFIKNKLNKQIDEDIIRDKIYKKKLR